MTKPKVGRAARGGGTAALEAQRARSQAQTEPVLKVFHKCKVAGSGRDGTCRHARNPWSRGLWAGGKEIKQHSTAEQQQQSEGATGAEGQGARTVGKMKVGQGQRCGMLHLDRETSIRRWGLSLSRMVSGLGKLVAWPMAAPARDKAR